MKVLKDVTKVILWGSFGVGVVKALEVLMVL